MKQILCVFSILLNQCNRVVTHSLLKVPKWQFVVIVIFVINNRVIFRTHKLRLPVPLAQGECFTSLGPRVWRMLTNNYWRFFQIFYRCSVFLWEPSASLRSASGSLRSRSNIWLRSIISEVWGRKNSSISVFWWAISAIRNLFLLLFFNHYPFSEKLVSLYFSLIFWLFSHILSDFIGL